MVLFQSAHAGKKSGKTWIFDRFAFMAFFPISLFYMEMLLRFGTSERFFPYALPAMIFFTLSLGLFLYILCSIPKQEKYVRLVTLIVIGVIIIIFLIEFFCKRAYQSFFDFRSLLAGTGGVAGQFKGVVLKTVLKGFWAIILFCLPFLYLFFLGGKLFPLQMTRQLKFPMLIMGAAGMVAAFLLGLFFTVISSNTRLKYNKQYNFDTAVQTFGLTTAVRLDGKHMVFKKSTADFEAENEEADLAELEQEILKAEEIAREKAEMEKKLGSNKLDIDFAALAEKESSSTYASMDSYVAGLTASSRNEYTGIFEGKNLIVICAEAFSAEVIRKDLTPTLYRMATKGIQVKEFYQPSWGGSTASGEFSVLTGMMPTDGVNSSTDIVNHNNYLTMGNQLRRLGYSSHAYHNNTASYYARDRVLPSLGYDSFMAIDTGLNERGVTWCWPESDLEMMEATLSDYINDEHFSAYYMSVSGHCLYNTINSMAARNLETVEACEGLKDASTTVKCYFAAQYELEKALTYLIRELEKAGKADDTVIVVCADHYPYGLEKSDSWQNDEDFLHELYGYYYDTKFERDHNALLLWSGCLEDRAPIVVDTPCYSLDIVPTLSNLFGVEYDSRLLIGRDILSSAPALCIWPDYSWATELGYYNTHTGEFVPRGDVEVSDKYIELMKSRVSNKITYSIRLLGNDYFGHLFD